MAQRGGHGLGHPLPQALGPPSLWLERPGAEGLRAKGLSCGKERHKAMRLPTAFWLYLLITLSFCLHKNTTPGPNKASPLHAGLGRHLWGSAFPPTEEPTAASPTWRTLGWQHRRNGKRICPVPQNAILAA